MKKHIIFDTYEHHSFNFWLARALVLTPILMLIYLYLFWNNVNVIVLIILIVIIAVCILIGSLIFITPSKGNLYVKNGEIIFTNKNITADYKTFDIESLSKVQLLLMGYRGQWQGAVDSYATSGGKEEDGLGNQIKLYKQGKLVLKKLFVLNSSQDLQDMKSVLDSWIKSGIKIKILGDEVNYQAYKYRSR